MKMYKKFFALILSLTITASVPATAFAAETSDTSTATVAAATDNTVSSTTENSNENNENSESSDISYLFSENTSGNANLVASQEVIADNGKFQFIAVQTRNDDIFYIIIDKEKTEDNVYFLNEVDTYDIQSLLNKDNDNSDYGETGTEVSDDNAENPGGAEESSSEQESNGDNNFNFNLILIGGIAVLAIIGFIIFKVKKGGFGKKKQADVPIDDDFEDDDSEEINEDKEKK